jgi:Na+/H+ antiporter NhaD/arsenite permease-like protein
LTHDEVLVPVRVALAFFLLLAPAYGAAAAEHDAGHGAGDHAAGDHAAIGVELPLWTVLPFATLLLAIAFMPLAAGHWWHSNVNKGIVSLGLATITTIYVVAAFQGPGIAAVLHVLSEYVSFILLLGALYIISGGIYIRGSLSGTPLANTGLMALGAVLANFIGTTGASVLLVRPLLRANKSRAAKAHIVIFFIFIVSNCGGLLTPLGDPPLFMGFTAGVPFTWTLTTLWVEWLAVNVALLVLFQVWDQIVFGREERERPGSQLEEVLKHEPLGVSGGLNFLFLAGVVAAVYCKGVFHWPWGVQEAIMAAMAILAYLTTPAANRTANAFSFGPIVEVAVLFVGIFITMAPALQILNAWGSGHRDVLGYEFAMSRPWQFFWATGILSSFLDNAPTYMTIAATAAGTEGVAARGQYLADFLQLGPEAAALLAAISCGAVFMGANTYIGNGPNFMVKAIAEENGVRMPSFFGYMAYSGIILIPLFALVSIVFFRG